ncbi:tetratricopeptide repeat protein [Halalkalibaculum sp. DA3122]|uniref:tetratricopeptide repeat protein n=1 Tax=Halalkalibaculum sp. DA3122 TaxID=3373607 RepID=UPI003754C596
MIKQLCTFGFSMVFLLAVTVLPLQGQNNQQYHVGNQLLQQQKYEQAYQIFEKLHQQNPANPLFLQKATECLINLKRYEEAISMAEKAIEQSDSDGRASVRLAEIYHVKGDTARAFSIWDQTLAQHSNFQTYLDVARTMSDRREFARAVEIYEQARTRFSNTTLLATELANTYMQAAQYENAVNEFLQLVREEPDRIDYVQRSLIRYGDEYLHDIAILEIEEFLDDLSFDHPSHRHLHQLHQWLLLERNLYERAVAAAKAYEQQSENVTYSLLALGNRLISEHEYELAEEAYQYYIRNDIVSAKYQSMEQLSQVYQSWADFLSEHNLAHARRRDSLYQQSFDILQQLQAEAPYYNQMGRVRLRQAELAIDYLHDVELAKKYLTRIQNQSNESNSAQQFYVEGRIKLYEQDYARARIAFTRSNKQEGIGSLAEKTRYYLALTDFYAGDYEFAKIQLNSLEKQTTSYYANDAVQLRIWIQKGLSADSTGSIIEPFARGMEHFNQGKHREAVKALSPIISAKAYHPLMDEALLELSKHITPDLTYLTYAAISNYLDRWGQASALRERLMWEKARIADQVVTNRIPIDQPSETPSPAGELFPATAAEEFSLPESQQQVQTLYENILLEFPNGFYASYARNRIQELKNPQT